MGRRSGSTRSSKAADAIKTGEIQYFDGTSVKPQWRQFAETAADHNDVAGPVRVPIVREATT